MTKNTMNLEFTTEEWLPVVGLNGYDVSNIGRVRGNARWIVNSRGIRYFIEERILRPSPGKPYLNYHISINNKSYYRLGHRMVAETFLPNPNNYNKVNHKNGIKTDNRVENLEWCTSRENTLHAYRMDLMKANPRLGEDCHFSKLSKQEVTEIRQRYSAFMKELQGDFGVGMSTVRAIVNGSAWKHVSP